MSGYGLTKLFDVSLSNVWAAQHSQIYPELARLLEADLIQQVGDGPRGKKLYAITDAGLAAVRWWLVETEPERAPRNEAVLRTFFLWLLPREDAIAWITREKARYEIQRDHYAEIAATWLPVSASDDALRLTLEAGIRIEQAKVEWAEWALVQLASPERDADTD